MKPVNIFEYADKELASTAFLCWLFSHLQKDTPDCQTKEAALNLLKAFLSLSAPETKIDENEIHTPKIKKDYPLKCGKRKLKIDIYIQIKTNDADINLFIENKVNSGFSGANQLIDYSSAIDTEFKGASTKPIKIYYKSRFDLDAPLTLGKENIQTGFIKYDHKEITQLFSNYTNTSSEILNSYSQLAVNYNNGLSISSLKYSPNHAGYYKLFYDLFGSCLDNKESQDPKLNRIYLTDRVGFLENGTSFGSPYLVFSPCNDMSHIFVRLESNRILRCGCYLGNNIKGNPCVDDFFVKFRSAAANHNFKHLDKIKLKKNRNTAIFLKIEVVNIEDFKGLNNIIREYISVFEPEIKTCL